MLCWLFSATSQRMVYLLGYRYVRKSWSVCWKFKLKVENPVLSNNYYQAQRNWGGLDLAWSWGLDMTISIRINHILSLVWLGLSFNFWLVLKLPWQQTPRSNIDHQALSSNERVHFVTTRSVKLSSVKHGVWTKNKWRHSSRWQHGSYWVSCQ